MQPQRRVSNFGNFMTTAKRRLSLQSARNLLDLASSVFLPSEPSSGSLPKWFLKPAVVTVWTARSCNAMEVASNIVCLNNAKMNRNFERCLYLPSFPVRNRPRLYQRVTRCPSVFQMDEHHTSLIPMLAMLRQLQRYVSRWT